MSAESLLHCPSCESNLIVKNGKIHNGKQNYRCRNCGRQFVKDRQNKIISQETKDIIDKLLLKKIPLAGIARATNVSERSRRAADRPGGLGSGASALQSYVNAKYESVSLQVKVKTKKKAN